MHERLQERFLLPPITLLDHLAHLAGERLHVLLREALGTARVREVGRVSSSV